MVKKAKEDPSLRERLAGIYSDQLDQVSKKYQLTVGLNKQPRVSSGLLVLDLMLGGGVPPGMITFFGQEAGGKSTCCMSMLGSAIRAEIPVNFYFDGEGSVDPKYTAGILKVKSLEEVFGVKDNKTGKWIVPPKARYSDANVIEDIFKPIHTILRGLPNKVYRPERNEWFLVFGREKEEVAKRNALGIAHDKKLYTDTGMYWCPIGDDSSIQAIFFIDSYASLVTEDVDDQEDEGNSLALEARSFSKYVKRITGRLRKKAAVLAGVNQLRDKPMDKYNPYTEPGGKALQFFSSCRNMVSSTAVPQGWDRDSDNGRLCIEESVDRDGGFDYYAFKSIKNIKNKYGTPFRKSIGRVWVEDARGRACGFDPVYDCFSFYQSLGLIEGNRKKDFIIKGIPKIEGYSFNWHSFKTLVVAEFRQSIKLRDKAIEMGAPKFKLMEHGYKLLASGEAENLYVKSRQKGNSEELDDIDA